MGWGFIPQPFFLYTYYSGSVPVSYTAVRFCTRSCIANSRHVHVASNCMDFCGGIWCDVGME